MPYDPHKHHRRSIRLAGYDYASEGAYFITICAQTRDPWFGVVQDGTMRLNAFGRIVEEEWQQTSIVRPAIIVDTFIVMPDHLHGILIIDRNGAPATHRVAAMDTDDDHRATHRVAPGPARGSIGAIIGQFKSVTTKRINHLRDATGVSVWQRNYYEHIIHNEQELQRVHKYIIGNSARWSTTC